ncbi:hypothetical protein EYF80_055566 [Liparis tanakae]|uniref:Uncharacterized protein n=1 Tax=Liparis tanakae TaxID=230148 RepID=A0A4Z2F061_9TELE|nr:hypothetical protein EYF80_055566 [Liparis tanakae]
MLVGQIVIFHTGLSARPGRIMDVLIGFVGPHETSSALLGRPATARHPRQLRGGTRGRRGSSDAEHETFTLGAGTKRDRPIRVQSTTEAVMTCGGEGGLDAVFRVVEQESHRRATHLRAGRSTLTTTTRFARLALRGTAKQTH